MLIYNVDETGVTVVTKPTVVTQVGRKAIAAAESNVLPPMNIFPRERLSDKLLHGCVPGTLGFVFPKEQIPTFPAICGSGALH